MSRTELDAATLASSLRRMAGDGSVEWCYEPIQASVMLDVADMLDEVVRLRSVVSDGADNARQIMGENRKLRELVRDMWRELDALVPYDPYDHDGLDEYRDRMRGLGIEVGL